MRLLLANPNTTDAVTQACAAAARAAAMPGTEIVPVTAAFGPAIINTRTENALAAHGMLDLLARHHQGMDAVLLAVSYDTALDAARELLPLPVVGMTEAAILTACLVGRRFGLVTFGTPTLYRELVAGYGFTDRLAGVHVIDASAAEATRDPASVAAKVGRAAEALVAEGADAVVLCGAAMAGMAATLQPASPVPLLDGITCGVALCEMLVRLNLPKPRAGSYAAPTGRASTGFSAELTRMLGRSTA